MNTRYSFGGDEHIFVEIDEEMSLDAFFKSLSITQSIKAKNFDGVSEVYPANASFQIRFDPDIISPTDMMAELYKIEETTISSNHQIDTRIIEIPVYYQDPWTHETLMRFRERHQTPDGTDIEYATQVNGYDSVESFIQAHSGSPWFVTMIGFAAGVPWLYQMVERHLQLEAPKYLRPRTDTPKLTVGYGGCFGCIYSVRGAGGYQMLGITPMPIYDPHGVVKHLKEFLVFFSPGDIVKFNPIDSKEYEQIVIDVENGSFVPKIQSVNFSLAEFQKDIHGYNRKLKEILAGH